MRKPKRLNPALVLRPDGRPEVYCVEEVADSAGYECFLCTNEGADWRRHKADKVYMSSPVNNTHGKAAFICHEHLDDASVIYDPRTNMCRDKSGENTWSADDDE